jgi:hypothetical protein
MQSNQMIRYVIANTVTCNILSTWSILSDWKDKMVIAKQFGSIQSILPGISNESLKISKRLTINL